MVDWMSSLERERERRWDGVRGSRLVVSEVLDREIDGLMAGQTDGQTDQTDDRAARWCGGVMVARAAANEEERQSRRAFFPSRNE